MSDKSLGDVVDFGVSTKWIQLYQLKVLTSLPLSLGVPYETVMLIELLFSIILCNFYNLPVARGK